MNLIDAQILARAAMNAHGLGHWTFAYNRRKSAFGLCFYHRREIQLSSILTEHASKDQVVQTIGHEIAHALVGHGHGHGPVWRDQMRSMGLVPDRCGEASEAQKAVLASTAKYVLTCAVNGKQIGTLDRIVKSRRVKGRGMFDMPRTLTYSGHLCKCHGAPALYNGRVWEEIA